MSPVQFVAIYDQDQCIHLSPIQPQVSLFLKNWTYSTVPNEEDL